MGINGAVLVQPSAETPSLLQSPHFPALLPYNALLVVSSSFHTQKHSIQEFPRSLHPSHRFLWHADHVLTNPLDNAVCTYCLSIHQHTSTHSVQPHGVRKSLSHKHLKREPPFPTCLWPVHPQFVSYNKHHCHQKAISFWPP